MATPTGVGAHMPGLRFPIGIVAPAEAKKATARSRRAAVGSPGRCAAATDGSAHRTGNTRAPPGALGDVPPTRARGPCLGTGGDRRGGSTRRAPGGAGAAPASRDTGPVRFGRRPPSAIGARGPARAGRAPRGRCRGSDGGRDAARFVVRSTRAHDAGVSPRESSAGESSVSSNERLAFSGRGHRPRV